MRLSTVCRSSGSQIARAHAMRAPVIGLRVECASVRFASPCGGGRSIRPRYNAAFSKRFTVMRLNR
eukprot:103113-Lingulodinium_polyedra.AAC.1